MLNYIKVCLFVTETHFNVKEVFSPPMHWSFLHNKAHSWSFFTINGFSPMECIHNQWFSPTIDGVFPTTSQLVFSKNNEVVSTA